MTFHAYPYGAPGANDPAIRLGTEMRRRRGQFASLLLNWRTYVPLIVLLIIFEDGLRKFSDGNIVFFFLKDVLLLWIYGLFFLSRPERLYRLPSALFWTPLGLWFSMSVAQAFNPLLPTWLVAVVGIHNHFMFMPMVLVTYAYLREIDDIALLLKLIAFGAVVVSTLGMAQVIIGPGFLNPTDLDPRYQLDVVRGGTLRVTSIYIDRGRYALFLEFAFHILLGAHLLLPSQARYRMLRRFLIVALIMVWLGIITSGSRFPVVTSTLTLLAIGVYKRPLFIARLSAIAVILVGTLSLAYPKATDGILEFLDTHILEQKNWTDRYGQVARHFNDPVMRDTFFVGRGTGAVSNGVQYLYARGGQALPGTETGPTAVIMAFGVLGLPIWFWLVWGVVGTAARIRSHLRHTRMELFAFSIMMLTINHLILHNFISPQSFENYTSSFFMWLAMGMLMKLGHTPWAFQSSAELDQAAVQDARRTANEHSI